MIDHVSLHVSDLEKAKAFYSKALAPIGYVINTEMSEWKIAGFGEPGKSDLWIAADGTKQANHVAFRVTDKQSGRIPQSRRRRRRHR